ncbi:MAG: hypothetical protein ABIT05_08625 [Chitinophagaceae bacterium]
MLTGAIIGAIIGLLVVVFTFFAKEQKFNKILKTISGPMEYAALYHYASAKRYKNSFKFFDSYGVLYLAGKTLYYKTSTTESPLSFDLSTCTVQAEEDWRWLKWFSVTTATGEKYYFDSNKMGALKNNSDETMKGLAAIKAKMSS